MNNAQGSSAPAGDADELIEGHGLVLRRVGEQDIEQLRQWRNDPAVSQFMESRQSITPDMQRRWFASFAPERDFFYIVQAEGRALGVVNFKGLDGRLRTAESGIYLADPGQRGRGLGRAAYRVLLEHGFARLGLEIVVARVLSDNPKSIRLHLNLGFKVADSQDARYNQLYVLRKADYIVAVDRP